MVELRMTSSTLFLVIFSSLVFSGLCNSSFSNQQVRKIIRTKYGVYDCVDFYKQPAFSHPLLKHHTFKVLPNLIELQEQKVSDFGLKDGGCLIGTVPILRTNQNFIVDSLESPRPKMHCVALVHTNNLNRKFYGVGGTPTHYRPQVNSNQRTSARIKLSNGNDSFEAGWMINPKVFNDHEAHLYTSFDAGGKGCINLQCPGFVQVSTFMPLGMTPDKYSVIGGPQHGWNVSIDKHQDDGNWWLSATTPNAKVAIGYWPKALFSPLLANVADKVEWGGEIYDYGPSSSTSAPPGMGSGLKATYNMTYSAAFIHATYVDENFINVIDPKDTHMVMDCQSSYTVLDGGMRMAGRIIYYGGPL